jgi:hypothetical protein
MIRPRPADAAPPPGFYPVPVRARRDGWTPGRQRAFIAALASTQCVDRSAAAVGLSRESAYRLRRRAGAESFAAAWDAIMARRPLHPTRQELTWHRAFYGTLKPIVRKGQVMALLHRTDNNAFMALLHRMDRAERSRARMLGRLDRGESSR